MQFCEREAQLLHVARGVDVTRVRSVKIPTERENNERDGQPVLRLKERYETVYLLVVVVPYQSVNQILRRHVCNALLERCLSNEFDWRLPYFSTEHVTPKALRYRRGSFDLSPAYSN